MATPCRRPVNGPCAVPADSRHFRPERVKADLSDLEASRSASSRPVFRQSLTTAPEGRRAISAKLSPPVT
uniref:YbeA n=2 Tax=Enterobacteriaceae TaxID=543 RepID=W0M0Z5_ECOLX|nr:YbeA [Escherichia coli]ASU05437.1 YbeA protein [Escherichia coli]BAA75105.1 ybeA [Shigella sonnei]CDH80813.1 hypothetical protein YbeA [Salmonella enterica subsp. enterica serovar Typhimurium str. STM709]